VFCFSDGDAVGREAVRRRLAKTHVHASWIYGADLLAVADGSAAAVTDGIQNQTPNKAAAGIRNPKDYPGNHVSLQIAPDVWAVYAHMQPGRITVRPGDKVTKGPAAGRMPLRTDTCGTYGRRSRASPGRRWQVGRR
jgi:murein DD-endopeptidase MepM/ murein hydrolase activator NlpD